MESQERECTEIQEWLQQGKVLLGNGQNEEAIRYFDRVLAKDPMQFDAYIGRGIAKADGGGVDSAFSDFQRANMLNKKHPDPYFHMGNVYFMQGKFEDGVKAYNQAIALGYDEPDLYFHFGIVYEEAEDFDSAIRYYTKAIHMDELNPIYRVRKTVVQIRANKLHEALETLEGLYKCAPDSFEYYHLSSIVYVQMGNFDKAGQLLDEATTQFPDDFDLLNDRIRLLVSKNDLHTALSCLKKAGTIAQNDNDRKEILISTARVYGGLEKFDSAASCLEEALSIGDETVSDCEASYLLINLYQIQKKYAGMVMVAQRLKQAKEQNAYTLSAWYYEALGHKLNQESDFKKYYDSAIKEYRRIALGDPSRLDAYLYRAMCYKDIKDYAKALEMVDYVIALQPQNGELHLIKAGIFEEMGNKQDSQTEQSIAKSIGNSSLLSGMIGG